MILTRNTQLGLAVTLLAAAWILGSIVSGGSQIAFDQHISAALSLRRGQSPAELISLLQGISWSGGGGPRYVIVALIGALLLRWRSWQSGAAMVMASILSNAASGWMKDWFARPRPELVPHLDHVNSISYPSGHATSAAVVYLLFALLVPTAARSKWLATAALLILLTGWSRIALGVHYPTDVIGGWMLGTAFALAASALVPMKGASASPVTQ